MYVQPSDDEIMIYAANWIFTVSGGAMGKTGGGLPPPPPRNSHQGQFSNLYKSGEKIEMGDEGRGENREGGSH